MLTFINIFDITDRNKIHTAQILYTIKISCVEDADVFLNKNVFEVSL